jgi:hypothetical protein
MARAVIVAIPAVLIYNDAAMPSYLKYYCWLNARLSERMEG